MAIRNADAERVRNTSFFRDADDETFNTAINGAFLQRFPANTTLLMEGDTVDFLYILLEGSVELGAGWKSKDTTLANLTTVSSASPRRGAQPDFLEVDTKARAEAIKRGERFDQELERRERAEERESRRQDSEACVAREPDHSAN